MCYRRERTETGEVRGDPLADSPEESRISPPCELSSKHSWCPLGTLGKYWSRSAMTQFVFYRKHFSRIHCIISTSTFSDDLIFHCWTFRLVCLLIRDAGMTKRLKLKNNKGCCFSPKKTIHFKPISVINVEGCASTHGFMQLYSWDKGCVFGPTVNRGWKGLVFPCRQAAAGHRRQHHDKKGDLLTLTQYSS